MAFEFIEKLGAPFYAFHDRDVAPEGASLEGSNRNLDAVVQVLKGEQQRTGIKLLWATANLFTPPRFVHGAATSPNADVFAQAAAQVKKALEVVKELRAAGYVFWGGREGYSRLRNADLKREVDHLARFLHMAVEYKKAIGFEGPFYIGPKPREPTTKHQYDSDAAACLNFLRQFWLLEHFKLNLETNHATLAGALGSIDANTGDELIGWDTDQFPTSLYLAVQVMLVVLKMGGFTTGGLNFDARVRRESFASAQKTYDLVPGLPPGHLEQDPQVWLEAVDATIQACLQPLGPRKNEVRALGISGQQHGLVALNDADKGIRPAKLWCDTSTARQFEEIIRAFGAVPA